MVNGLGATCLAISATLIGLAAGAAAAQELNPVRCSFGLEVAGWRGQVTCHSLRVPENRADPASAELDLAVYELRAMTETPGPPILYLSGGPGVAGSYYVDLLLRHPMRGDRPIIILEQRGVGASDELCPTVRRDYFRRVASRRSNDLRSRQFIGIMHRCFARARERGRNIDAYTTSENAADVASLRAALGLDRVDLWAVSYGTVLAQAYMRLEPDAIGAVVFDAAVPIDYALETNLTSNFRRALHGHWQACVAEGACDAGAPSFEQRLIALIPDYDQRPIRLLGFSPEPAIIVNSVYVTGVDAAGIVFSLLYENTNHRTLDRVLSILERRSASFLRAHYQRLVSPGFSFAMHYAINCRGPRLTPSELELLRSEDPVIFDAMRVGDLTELCDASDLLPAGPRDNAPVHYSGRMLVLSGEFDPITPLSVAAPLRTRFPAAGFLEIPHGGHGPSRSVPCAQEIVRAYFAEPGGAVLDICGMIEGP